MKYARRPFTYFHVVRTLFPRGDKWEGRSESQLFSKENLIYHQIVLKQGNGFLLWWNPQQHAALRAWQIAASLYSNKDFVYIMCCWLHRYMGVCVYKYDIDRYTIYYTLLFAKFIEECRCPALYMNTIC